MAVSYIAVNNAAGQAAGNTTPAGVAAITPTMPAGTQTGDRVYVLQGTSNTTAASPADWTPLFKDTVVGTGAVGAGTGQRRISCHYRDYDGVWTMPSFALTSATQNSHHLSAVTLRKSATELWDDPTYSPLGTDYGGTINTAFSCTTSDVFTTIVGALLLAQSVTNDNVTSSSPGITGTNSLAVANVAERTDGGTATGNDVSGKLHTANVSTAASPAGTLTFASTLNAASEGGTCFIQQTSHEPPGEGGASSVWGWDSTASGARASHGGAASDYGWDSTASGERDSRGSAASDYGWESLASGARASRGAATSDYGWQSLASGEHHAKGGGSSDFGWASTAGGRHRGKGGAAALYGWESIATGEAPLLARQTATLILADNPVATMGPSDTRMGAMQLLTGITATMTLQDTGIGIALSDEAVKTRLVLDDIPDSSALLGRL